jgi:hypothetical protein
MSYGPIQQASLVIASGASTSSHYDFGGKSGTYLCVYHTAGFSLDLFGSNDGTTFGRLFERVNTAPVQYQTMIVGSNTSGGWAQMICPSVRYVKFAATGTVADGTTVKVCFAD